MKFQLEKVHYMPKVLAPGVLYVSKEFSTAAHLCACGCGSKIRTPLGPTEWSVQESVRGPSLWPSVGNWQQACQSHYVISHGEVKWAGKWSASQIKAGRLSEDQRRRAYYKTSIPKKQITSAWDWVKQIFGRG